MKSDLTPLFICLLIMALQVPLSLAAHYRRKYHRVLAENERLQNELDAKTVRFAEAPPAGTPIVITYQTDFDWQADFDFTFDIGRDPVDVVGETVEPDATVKLDFGDPILTDFDVRSREMEQTALTAYRRDTEARLQAYRQQFFRNTGYPPGYSDSGL